MYIFCTQWWCSGTNVEVRHRQHTLHYYVTCKAAYMLLVMYTASPSSTERPLTHNNTVSWHCRLTPESPRWLLVNDREDEARAILERIALGNGKFLPACQLKKPVVGSSREGVSTLDLFRRKNIRHRTIIFACSW